MSKKKQINPPSIFDGEGWGGDIFAGGGGDCGGGGWLRFDRYLDIVQHDAECGFYGSGRVCFGGDFATAAAVSPLFAGALSGQLAQILHSSGGGVLEIGAGDGLLARQLLSVSDCARGGYAILESSPALRELQKKNLAGLPVQWRDDLPRAFCGVVIANEVLDCIPFRLLRKRGGEWLERGVVLQNNDGGFAFAERPLAKSDKRLIAELPPDLPEGYATEICPRAEDMVRAVAASLSCGAALFLDYGFGAGEYYHPQRTGGTMMCHRGGLSDSDPLESPGEKDITAHVNFSAMAKAAESGGAKLLGYATQAQFLINCGITDLLASHLEGGAAEYARLAAGANKLLSPAEMGEFFKVAAFGKNAPPLSGFRAGGKSRLL